MTIYLTPRSVSITPELSCATPRAHSHESMNLLQALQQRGHETKVKVLALQTARPPGTVAMQMQLGSDEEAVYCARLRHIPPEELAHTASPRIVHDLVLMKHRPSRRSPHHKENR